MPLLDFKVYKLADYFPLEGLKQLALVKFMNNLERAPASTFCVSDLRFIFDETDDTEDYVIRELLLNALVSDTEKLMEPPGFV